MRAIYGICCAVIWLVFSAVAFGDDFLLGETWLVIMTTAIAFAGGAAGGA